MPTILQFRPSISSYRFGAVLQDEEYIFDVRWNSRDSAWYFDVREIDETPIKLGIKVVLGTYFGRSSNHPLFHEGAMVARPPSTTDRREATFDDLGTRVQIWYYTRDEIVQEIIGNLTEVTGGA
jgi:hypothetical protein